MIELNSKDVYGSLYGRFDAEFFNKKYIENEKSLDFKQSVFLSELAVITDGEHGSPDLDDESGIIYLSGNNVKDNQIDFGNVRYCTEKLHVKNARSSVKKNTVLMSIVGTVGKASVVHDDVIANTDRNVATIKPNTLINPHYLSIFLNCKFGTNQTDRFSTGNVQPLLNLSQLKQIKICNFGMGFQCAIAELSQAQDEKLKQSKASYTQAEQTLLEAVGLADFKPSTQNTNIKTFAQSFGTSGRLDAEYYQPKYDYLEKVFNQFERIKLQDLVNYPISSGITPKAGGDDYTDAGNGVPFVRAVDLQNGLVSIDNFNYIKPEIHTGVLKRTQLKQNDFLFSIAGTVGRCAIFEHTFEANINQAVAILRFNDARVNPYYLMMFFNSSIGKEFVGKYSRQGLQTNLNLSEVGDLSIPIIDLATQTNISQLVQQSFTLKAQSEHLLSVAKRAVEMAIEQVEAAARRFIENSQ